MILVKEMPTSGQFVAVWEFNGEVWSDRYQWDKGGLMEYDPDSREWYILYGITDTDHLKDASFILQSPKA